MGSKSSSSTAQTSENKDARIANDGGNAVSGDGNTLNVTENTTITDGGAFDLAKLVSMMTADTMRLLGEEQGKTLRALSDDLGVTVRDLYADAGSRATALLTNTSTDSTKLLDKAIGLVGQTVKTAGPDGVIANERRDMTIVIGLAMAAVAAVAYFQTQGEN